MKRAFAMFLMLAATATAAFADTSAERDIPLQGNATLYGGEMSDPIGPVTGGDAKLFLDLTGKTAQRMFDLMGKAADQRAGACSEPGVTERRRGVVSCMHDKDGYACYLAYDLKTGKAILQTTC